MGILNFVSELLFKLSFWIKSEYSVPRSNFFHFHAVFEENIDQIIDWQYRLWSWRLLREILDAALLFVWEIGLHWQYSAGHWLPQKPCPYQWITVLCVANRRAIWTSGSRHWPKKQQNNPHQIKIVWLSDAHFQDKLWISVGCRCGSRIWSRGGPRCWGQKLPM